MLLNRNIRLDGGKRSSMRLGLLFWEALEEVCRREAITIANLVALAQADAPETGRTEAVRDYLLSYFRSRIPPE